MGSLAAGVASAVDLLGSGSLARVMAVACETVAAARGLTHVERLLEDTPPAVVELLAGFAAPDADAELGPSYAAALAGRHDSGSFYTPPALVDWVLDRALEPLLDEALEQGGPTPRVLDPACGAGAFLVPAARRLAGRLDRPMAEVVAHGVHGVDLDPVAVAISRFLLWLEAPELDREVLARAVRVGDGLAPLEGPAYDLVVGNPPFLAQLRRRTSTAPRPGLGAYTDTSAVFLHHALDLVRTGGRVALVQPMSLLAARDAAPVRMAVTEAGAVTAFWSSPEPVFPGTPVLTCAPVIELGRRQGPVATWHGPTYARGVDVSPTDRTLAHEWGVLAAPSLGIPSVALTSHAGTLGDLGACTADFRDQYYGLAPFVREGLREGVAEIGVDEAPLVTSGLVDPAVCRWGEVATRFAKQTYAAPVVDLAALHADGRLSAWARARMVPKVLVATQGRVIEAVVDETGAWLPSVPVLTFTPGTDRLWHALAVLLAPPVVAHAATRFAGTALSSTAIKLSAKQLAGLPLPPDRDAWDRGAALARQAQLASSDHARGVLLRACAEVMGSAYDDDSALDWWSERAGRAGSAGAGSS